MKPVYLLFYLFFCTASQSQQLPVLSRTSLANPADDIQFGRNGNYAVDTAGTRDKYVGLWEYRNDSIVFQLLIVKEDMVLNKSAVNAEPQNYSYFDGVALRYKIIKKGIVLYDGLKSGKIFYGCEQASDNYIRARMADYPGSIESGVRIKMLNFTPSRILFHFDSHRYEKLKPPSFYKNKETLFYIPVDGVEMVKIE